MDRTEIRKVRKKLGRTQRTFAKILSVSHITVGRWERGESKPSPVFREKLEKLQAYVYERDLTARENM